jgi:hypothetical protein
MPFAIDWLNTPSPARSAPSAGRFVSMQVASPDAAQLAAQFAELQIDVEVLPAKQAAISATIETAHGSVSLHSNQQSLALRD